MSATGLRPTGARTGSTASARTPTRPRPVRRASFGEAVSSTIRSLDRPQTPYYLLAGASALLLVLGLVMVLSASSVRSYADSGSSFTLVSRQAMWLCLGLPLMLVATRMTPRTWRLLAYPALFLAVALLFGVALFGVEVNGNKNWLALGPVRLQPSEPAKLALVLWGADLMSRKHRLLDTWKHLLVPLVPVAMFMIALVMVGSDLGTALILGSVMAALLYFAGAPKRLFAGMGLAVLGAVLLLSSLPSTRYRMNRITSWLDPSADPSGIGYQALHGKYALGTGGWFGVGLGASRQKLPSALPEAHTDFIYAIIGEELGLFGTVAVLLLFAAIGIAGFRIALNTSSLFVRYASAGATSWILVQAMVNIGAVLGLLPITGIPLPLVSYGGSSLVPTMVALGMLLSFARRESLGTDRPDGPGDAATSRRSRSRASSGGRSA